jgi:hypothetical protein
MVFVPTFTFSQEETRLCGNEEVKPNETPQNNPENACFNVDLVIQNCTPVYIRMNFHFFTDDACTGNVQITNATQASAYKTAEQAINDANNTLANNQQQWNGTTTEIQCNPIRYVLSGVYIHCKTNALGGFSTPTLHANYGVNITSEINVYIANFPGNATGIGYPTYASFDWINTGNFNHEIGHTFSLSHSFNPNDGCDDTPALTHQWDKNCNGTIESNEQNLLCWSFIDKNELLDCNLVAAQTDWRDANKNGVHDCKEDEGVHQCNPQSPNTPGCANRPCCDWANINNNVMSYNAYQNAYSKCQIRKMLTDLANADCGFIESVGGCPPPSAFISQTPIDVLNTKYCSECIILEASFNDTKYSYRIINVATGVEEYNSGWTNGPVKNYCFSTSSIVLGGGIQTGGNHLKPNTNYRIELTVANDCEKEDYVEYLFKTPNNDCSVPNDPTGNGGSMKMTPNPTTGSAILEFNASSNEKVSIYSINTISSESHLLVSEYISVEGLNQINLNLLDLKPGNHRLLLVSELQNLTINISKF